MRSRFIAGAVLLFTSASLNFGADAPPPLDAAIRVVQVGTPSLKTLVPAPARRGTFLAPQAVSAIDISDDSGSIAVGTMAFRHDRNFFVLSSADGKVDRARYVEPWAPSQVAAVGDGHGFAAGMAYARQTEPFPIAALFRDEDKREVATVEDVEWDRGCLRYGAGDWRTGWSASLIGDLFVHGRGKVFTIAGNDNKALTWNGAGSPQQYSLSGPRPYRIATSGDGKTLAIGNLVFDISGLDNALRQRLGTIPKSLVSVQDTAKSIKLWDAAPSDGAKSTARPPEPSDEFPDLADDFHMKPAAMVPFRIAASVSLSENGLHVAVTEYGGWLRLRRDPLIGYWHGHGQGVNFCPRQRGRLRIMGANGKPVTDTDLPRDGLFDVRISADGTTVWCAPTSWFARGASGCARLPTDADANEVFVYDVTRAAWSDVLKFPDAVSDLAVDRRSDRVLISCWNGHAYILRRDASTLADVDVHGPGQVRWDSEGTLAVVGTQNGEVWSLEADGKVRWRTTLPVVQPPAAEKAKPVFDEVPVYSVGRVGPEHAYVGDTWLIKTRLGGILIDVGGTSGIPITLERIRAAGVDPADIRYVLITHSHGDHCEAAYLWRARGAEVVAPASAAYAMSWVNPGWSGYGVWPPCPIDRPLDLRKAGDESQITLCGIKINAIFVPGHSIDSVVYAMELNGHRVIFSGDIAFDDRGPGRPLGSNILHRCWADREKAKVAVRVIEEKVLPFKPEFEFKGHASHRDATEVWRRILRASQEAIDAGEPGK